MKTLVELKKELLKKVNEQQSIDQEIFDTVLGLNAFNIPTQTSCSGHIDKKWTYPYIDIYADNEQIEFNDYSPISIKIKEKWVKKNITIQEKLIELLIDFYSNRKTKFKYTITPHTVIDWGGIRLKSIGADTLQIMNKAQKTKELTKYQKEMKDFGIFLLKRYRTLKKS